MKQAFACNLVLGFEGFGFWGVRFKGLGRDGLKYRESRVCLLSCWMQCNVWGSGRGHSHPPFRPLRGKISSIKHAAHIEP